MGRLPHGYTNHTRRLTGGLIEKRYTEADGARAAVEAACLARLREYLPVPALVSFDEHASVIVMKHVPGRHGQELLGAGLAATVLELVGTTYRRLRELQVDLLPELPGDGAVITHGDFGPQNMLFDLDQGVVTAVLDWEFAHRGAPVEDLAWAEWIVRMHHPEVVDALPALFDGSGLIPLWAERHEAMVQRCGELLRLCEGNGDSSGEELWRLRTETTTAWTE